MLTLGRQKMRLGRLQHRSLACEISCMRCSVLRTGLQKPRNPPVTQPIGPTSGRVQMFCNLQTPALPGGRSATNNWCPLLSLGYGSDGTEMSV